MLKNNQIGLVFRKSHGSVLCTFLATPTEKVVVLNDYGVVFKSFIAVLAPQPMGPLGNAMKPHQKLKHEKNKCLIKKLKTERVFMKKIKARQVLLAQKNYKKLMKKVNLMKVKNDKLFNQWVAQGCR